MAQEFTIRHEFDCSEETFWNETFLSEEFNKRLYLETLKFPAYQIVSQKADANGKVERRVHVSPPVQGMPGPVKKVIGDKFSYDEVGTYDPTSHRYTFSIQPSTLPDKTRCTGEIVTEKLGDKRVVRTAKMFIEVKVFMVGSMVEERLLADLKASYEAASRFTTDYIKEKSL